MTGLTFNEALQMLLTTGLSTFSTLVTAGIIKMLIDRGHPPTDTRKEYISYIVPFVLVGVGYGGQLVFGYVVFNIDSLFAFVVNAGVVAFGSQFIYTAYKSTKRPVTLAEIAGAEARLLEPMVLTTAPAATPDLDAWRAPDPLTESAGNTSEEMQVYLQERGKQGPSVPPQEREG